MSAVGVDPQHLRLDSPAKKTRSPSRRPGPVKIPSFSSAASLRGDERTPSPGGSSRWAETIHFGRSSPSKPRGRFASVFVPGSGQTSPTRAGSPVEGDLSSPRRRENVSRDAKDPNKRRTFAGFGRRPASAFEPTEDSTPEGTKAEAGQTDVDKLVDKIIFKGGLDSSSPPAPILVIAPVHLPNNSAVPHATLLPKLRERLESYDSEYSVVLLTQPTAHPPATSLLVSTYLALPRQTRKNVRRVYVVGGGWWVKLVTTVFTTTLLSGKTAKRRKLVQCSTLSKLADELGTDNFVQLEFPPEVYAANANHESIIKLPVAQPTPPAMFGAPLESLMGDKGEKGLPRIVSDALKVIGHEAPTSVGIFRRSPSAVTVQQVREAYERGHPITLADYPDSAFLAASLLKLYLRELPQPLVPLSAYPLVRAIPLGGGPDAQAFVRAELLPALDRNTRALLRAVAAVLSETARHAEANLMPVANLIVCLGPCLVGGVSMESLAMTRVPAKGDKDNTVGGLLVLLIQHFAELFGEKGADVLSDVETVAGGETEEQAFTPTSATSTSLDGRAQSSATSLDSVDLHITKPKPAEPAEDLTPVLSPAAQVQAPEGTADPTSPDLSDLGAEWVNAEAAARRASVEAAAQLAAVLAKADAVKPGAE